MLFSIDCIHCRLYLQHLLFSSFLNLPIMNWHWNTFIARLNSPEHWIYRKYDHYVKHFLTKISSSIKLHLCVSKNYHRETVLNCNIAFVIHCRFAWFFLVFLILFTFYTIKTLFDKKWNMYNLHVYKT